MILQSWADESYRDLEDGRRVIAIAGWLSTPGRFKQFCPLWHDVLTKYGVKEGFHFNEYADRSHTYYSKTQYEGWSDEKHDSFLVDLALLACNVGVPVGGCCLRNETISEDESKKLAYRVFFKGVQQAVETKFKPKRDRVEFIFDENDDKSWWGALDDVLKEFKDRGAPFGNWTPKNDKEFLPLQAADLYAYAMRQNAEKYFQKKREPRQARFLDFVLEKNREDLANDRISPVRWEKTVRIVRSHRDQWKKENPGLQYYPFIHHPTLKTLE